MKWERRIFKKIIFSTIELKKTDDQSNKESEKTKMKILLFKQDLC